MRKMLLLLTIILVVGSIYAEPCNLLQFGESNVIYDYKKAENRVDHTRDVVLIDQQPNQSNGIFSDANCDFCTGGTQVVAENFVLNMGSTINQIILWTGYYPGNVPSVPDIFTVIFHNDSGGTIGTMITTETNVPSIRSLTGTSLFGVDEYMHTLTLVSPVALASGNYWVEIYNDSGIGTDDMFWVTGDLDPIHGTVGSAWDTVAPGSVWNYDSTTDLAFQLISTGGIPNDYCEYAIQVGEVTDYPFDTATATPSGAGDFITSPDLWYVFVPTEDGSINVDLCGSLYDTRLAIFEDCSALQVFENDDGCYDRALQSNIDDIPVINGTPYFIQVGGYSTNTGSGDLTIVFTPAPASGDCQHSIVLYDDYGDGWNGGMLDVIVGGTIVLDDITIVSGAGPEVFYFGVIEGELVEVLYTAGGWAYENSYYIFDDVDLEIHSSGVGGVEPATYAYDGYCGNCEWSIDLWDDYGDGWNGGSLDVIVGGTIVLDDITIVSGAGPETHYFMVYDGDLVEMIFTAGGWAYENYFDVYDDTDMVYVSNYFPDTSGPLVFDAYCSSGCLPPADLYADNVTQTAADLHWTEMGSATLWNLEIGAPGFEPETGTSLFSFDNITSGTSLVTQPVSGLSPGTGYDFFVQSNCVTRDSSNWSGPASFSTLPGNDTCLDAEPIGEVTDYPFNTSGATTSGFDTHSINQDIWYEFTAPGDGLLSVDLCGSTFDTKLAVYETCDNTTELDYNDDGCSLQSAVYNIPLDTGETCYIQVGGYSSASGAGDITIDFFIPGPGEVCSTALDYGLINDPPVTGSTTTELPVMWYEFELDRIYADVGVSLCNSSYNTLLEVRADCGDGSYLAMNDDSDVCSVGSQKSYVAFDFLYPGTYYAKVTGPGLLRGISVNELTVEEKESKLLNKSVYIKEKYPDLTRQGGDTIGDATVIGSLPYNDTGTTSGYSNDYFGAPDVVYSYTTSAETIVDVSLCGSSYDTKLYIWNSSLVQIAYNDDYCGLQSQVNNVVLPAGDTYYIIVTGFGSGSGNYVLNVTQLLGPYGDYELDITGMPGEAL